ncbi:MBL fold metallo-hydrolase [Terrisporobacter mayombei]|nr:MBL fold metallo-hydrolase [Terrisporobacter mayombei]
MIIVLLLILCCGCDRYKEFLSVHIIDVGQGDCILIKTPENQNILVDGGDDNTYKIIKTYLKLNKINNLDIVIATHLDKDHIGSLDEIINNFDVKKVYTPNQKDDSSHYYDLVKACQNKKLNLNHLSKGDSIKINNTTILNVLSPSYIQDNNNQNSIVFNLEYKNMDFLFTGDCEETNEIEMTNSFELEDVDFLKVAHHGSSSSSTDNFVKEASPSIAAISCGYKNQYGHPHKSTLDTLEKYGAKAIRTDVNGDLIFYSNGYKIFSTKNYK